MKKPPPAPRSLCHPPSQSRRERLRDVTVDIGVPVHNSLEDVKRCLASIDATRGRSHRVILVDDGSDDETRDYLERYAAKRAEDVLVRHETARGYTCSANEILKRAAGDWVILLNSDTIANGDWILRLVEVGESSPDIGVVGPMSNAASWQSVPKRFTSAEQRDFEVNEIPDGLEIADVDRLLDVTGTAPYPRVPLVNGFCYAMRREAIEAVGLLDEESFPHGYGEENDYSFRVSDAGFALVLATNTYVFHAKSKSFTHERRRALSKEGSKAFRAKYTPERIGAAIESMRHHPVLAEKRRLVSRYLETFPPSVDTSKSFSIVFLAECAPGGGGVHSIMQEAGEMRRLGADVRVAVPSEYAEAYRELYPRATDGLLFEYADDAALIRAMNGVSVVVGTIFNSIKTLATVVSAHPRTLPAYYAQDYEPYFFPKTRERLTMRTHPQTMIESNTARERRLTRRAEAEQSYGAIEHMAVFAKTPWICRTIEKAHKVPVFRVAPSIDHALYRPPENFDSTGKTREPGVVHVAAMVRVTTPRRAPHRTMEALAALHAEHGDRVRIHVFGSTPEGMTQEDLVTDFPFEDHGVLTREQVAELLRDVDVFADLSDYQAFGRTALEAMACGCAVVVPAAGGAHEYARNGTTALVVDTSDDAACFEALDRLVGDDALRTKLQVKGRRRSRDYTLRRAALSELTVLRTAYELAGLDEAPAGSVELAVRTPAGVTPTSEALEIDREVVDHDLTPDELAANRRVIDAFRADPVVDPRHLLWIVPSFDHILRGGLRTIFATAQSFSEHHGTRHTFVLYGREKTTEDEIRRQAAEAFPTLDADFLVFPAGQSVDVLPDSDAAFCTLWTTAFVLARYNRTRAKFYFIQDWEPGFYAAGSVSGLIEQTYRFGFCGIANTPGVGERYRQYEPWVTSFVPGVDRETFRPLDAPRDDDVHRVVFYGRPRNPRNGFRLGVEALRLVKNHFGPKVEIVSAGGVWPETRYGVERVMQNRGVLGSMDEVAALYRSADVGLVFMYTAHPSYQPLEYMASGCATVTNDNPANLWFLEHDRNAVLVENTISCVADGVIRLLEDPERRARIVRGGLESVAALNWDEAHAAIRAYVRNPRPSGAPFVPQAPGVELPA